MQQEVSAQLIRFISGMIIVFHKRTLLGRQPAQVSRPQRKGNFPGRTIVGNQRALEKQDDKRKGGSHLRHVQPQLFSQPCSD